MRWQRQRMDRPDRWGGWLPQPAAVRLNRGIRIVYIRLSPGSQSLKIRPPFWERRHRLPAAAGKMEEFHDHLENDDRG